MKKRTPAQQQRFDLKQEYPDCLLLFRLGDFYELFHDDAHVAHKVLALTLTAKNKKSDDPIPMAGIPYHALDKYLPKLVEAGYKVAIAEQVGEVTPGSVVKRAIVEVITPGTYIQENATHVLIAACRFGGDSHEQYHCAWGDYTLGVFHTQSVASFEQLVGMLSTIMPKELVVHDSVAEYDALGSRAASHDMLYSIHDHPQAMEAYIAGLAGVQTLAGFGDAIRGGRLHALSTLCSYIQQYQKQGSIHINTVVQEGVDNTVQLDPITLKNLEIFRSSYEGTEKHSLFGVINTTKTALGKRLLHDRLLYPTRQKESIQHRNSLITYFYNHADYDRIRKHLNGIIDIPRVLSRIFYKSPSPLVVDSLRKTLGHCLCDQLFCDVLQSCGLQEHEVTTLQGLFTLLDKALEEAIHDSSNGFIAGGFDEDVDRLRHIAHHSDQSLTAYHTALQKHTHCNTLKIKFSKNQGYSIEVTKKESDQLQATANSDHEEFDFVRIQSLKGADRYMTTYLRSLQDSIHDAQEQLRVREYALLATLIESVGSHKQAIQKLCDAISIADCTSSFAQFLDKGRTIPTVIDGGDLTIRGGRHPVVEAFLPTNEPFIPNDCEITNDALFHCITGPNMGGKSTYLRQNALLLLMAHAGLPVPADEMQYTIIDGLYARVGSGDALAKNQSTFMTEMIEMAYIVRNATADSFIVLDELGRGTSTYDGMALAQSLCVYICQKIQAPTLFATHYHELTTLEDTLTGFKNFNVSVYETGNDVVFLKKIVAGGADKSYGLDVAKIAGIPYEIIDAAKEYLGHYQEHQQTIGLKEKIDIPQQPGFDFGSINDTYRTRLESIEKELSGIDKDTLTPIEGLVLVHKILGLLGK